MIHHRRHSLITKRGKKKNQKKRKKVAKTRVVWRKKKKLVSAIRQKSNATRRVVNTPGPPLFNFNELAKIQDGPLSSTPPRFDVIMSRREGGATLCTIASMIRGGDTRKRILNVTRYARLHRYTFSVTLLVARTCFTLYNKFNLQEGNLTYLKRKKTFSSPY